MKIILSAVSVLGSIFVITPAIAADTEAGKKIATTVCAACHGANGISVSKRVPHLAAQRAGYLKKQLQAYKSKKRKHGIMSGITSQITDAAMADIAAYYASLPGVPAGAKNSKPPANFIAKRVKLPPNLSGFTHYKTFNHKRRKQLRKIYANRVAFDAARAGMALPDGSVIVVEAFKAKLGPDKKPVVGGDGLFVATKRAGYTAMERQSGWGNDFAALIRNGNWHYSVFKADGQPRPKVNQASCLSCHKPLDKDSYVFSIKDLMAAAKK